MTERKIPLSDELDALVEASMASGRYGSASEVVSTALRRLESEDDARKLEAFRAAVQVGLDDLDQGRSRAVPSEALEDHVSGLGSQSGGRRVG